jgi:hypothetical protein
MITVKDDGASTLGSRSQRPCTFTYRFDIGKFD